MVVVVVVVVVIVIVVNDVVVVVVVTYSYLQGCSLVMLSQATKKQPTSEGEYSDVASVDTDEGGSVSAADESDGHSHDDDDDDDEDTDADDDEFVDAGDDVEDVADHALWVTERRHSGDGEVRHSLISLTLKKNSFVYSDIL